MSKILIQTSAGELVDKLTILEIKKEKIKDPEKLKFINNEHTILKNQLDNNVKSDEKLNNLFKTICFDPMTQKLVPQSFRYISLMAQCLYRQHLRLPLLLLLTVVRADQT